MQIWDIYHLSHTTNFNDEVFQWHGRMLQTALHTFSMSPVRLQLCRQGNARPIVQVLRPWCLLHRFPYGLSSCLG